MASALNNFHDPRGSNDREQFEEFTFSVEHSNVRQDPNISQPVSSPIVKVARGEVSITFVNALELWDRNNVRSFPEGMEEFYRGTYKPSLEYIWSGRSRAEEALEREFNDAAKALLILSAFRGSPVYWRENADLFREEVREALTFVLERYQEILVPGHNYSIFGVDIIPIAEDSGDLGFMSSINKMSLREDFALRSRSERVALLIHEFIHSLGYSRFRCQNGTDKLIDRGTGLTFHFPTQQTSIYYGCVFEEYLATKRETEYFTKYLGFERSIFYLDRPMVADLATACPERVKAQALLMDFFGAPDGTVNWGRCKYPGGYEYREMPKLDTGYGMLEYALDELVLPQKSFFTCAGGKL
jgi:calcineurin-like phosphoesterase family protein